jgi:hypothetical protein
MNNVFRSKISSSGGTHEYIVTDLINTLPGNSSVNTAQQATTDEAVFSMLSAPSSGGTGSCNPFLTNGSVNTLRVSGDVISNRDAVFRGVCAECL